MNRPDKPSDDRKVLVLPGTTSSPEDTMISTEALAVLISLAVLVLATGLFFGLKRYAGGVDSAAFVALLLTPLFLYLVLSGRVQELYGPGGWGAKFRDTVHDSVKIMEIPVDPEPLQSLEKQGENAIPELIARLKPNVPNALVLAVGRGVYYKRDLIEKYLQAMMAAGPATYVVFVDDRTKQFVGSASGRQVLAAVSVTAATAMADRFMNDLEKGGEDPFAGIVGLVTESLSPRDTNVVALEKLVNTNADALVVSDERHRPIALVDRNLLVTKLMLKLAKE